MEKSLFCNWITVTTACMFVGLRGARVLKFWLNSVLSPRAYLSNESLFPLPLA